MINTKRVFLVVLWCVLSVNLFGQKICQVDFHVLPWTFRIEGEMTDSLVRSYDGYTQSTYLNDSLSLQEFGAVLALPTLRLDEISKRKFIPKVVIDVWLQRPEGSKGKSPYKRVIMLNEYRQISYEGKRYHKSDLLVSWLIKKEIVEE